MQLTTFHIPEDEAREKLAEYEAALRTERNAEDEAIARGYRAAARGLPVISLPRTIAAAGWFDDGLPRIAVVRADATECYARWNRSDLIYANRDDWRVNRGALVGVNSVRVTIPGDDQPQRRPTSWRTGRTIVPLIPPRYRPSRRGRLARLHVLWEVEQWAHVAPRDPALLQHIRGDLWAVLAVWDLTPLEQHVLTQR